MLSQKVLEAWIQRIEGNASARITGNAEDITELIAEAKLARRARHAHHKDFAELANRIEKLVVEQAGNDRTFRELISDNAELARCVDELDEYAALELARIRGLKERVEKLEKRVEPGFHFADMAYVQRVDEECIPDLQGPGQYVELKED